MRIELICLNGHKPRFYPPRLFGQSNADWGWKRRCDDFEAASNAATNAK